MKPFMKNVENSKLVLIFNMRIPYKSPCVTKDYFVTYIFFTYALREHI